MGLDSRARNEDSNLDCGVVDESAEVCFVEATIQPLRPRNFVPAVEMFCVSPLATFTLNRLSILWPSKDRVTHYQPDLKITV